MQVWACLPLMRLLKKHTLHPVVPQFRPAVPGARRAHPPSPAAHNLNTHHTHPTHSFDLLYLVLDARTEVRDRALGRHLVSLFHRELPESARPVSLGRCVSLGELSPHAQSQSTLAVVYARTQCPCCSCCSQSCAAPPHSPTRSPGAAGVHRVCARPLATPSPTPTDTPPSARPPRFHSPTPSRSCGSTSRTRVRAWCRALATRPPRRWSPATSSCAARAAPRRCVGPGA